MLNFAGSLILILATVVIVSLEKARSNPDNLVYFIVGGIGTYLFGIILLLIPKYLKKCDFSNQSSKTKNPPFIFLKVMFIVSIIISSALLSGIGWAIYELFVPKMPNIDARDYEICYNPKFTFSTTYGNLNETSESLFPRNLELPTNPNAYAWGESYTMRTFVHMYNATKNLTYLDQVLKRMDMVLSNKDINEDGVPGYGTEKYEDSYVEYIVWDGVILRPLMEAANIIKNTALLWSNDSYRDRAEEYASVSEQIVAKWNETHWYEVEGENMGYFLSPPGTEYPIFNRIHALAQLMLQLYEFTGKETYIFQVGKIARFFKANLYLRTYKSPDTINGIYPQKEMYHWGYDSEAGIDAGEKDSDTSHANLDVEFAYLCYQRGIVFTKKDMERFSNTFADFYYRGRIWQTSKIIEGKNHTRYFADHISGNGFDKNYYLNLRIGWYYLYSYYHNQTISSYIVLTSFKDLIDGGNYRGSLAAMTAACLRELIYLNPSHYEQFSPHL